MKDPETVRRIEHLARAETAMSLVKNALNVATYSMGLVVPMDHPIRQALTDASLSITKAITLTTQLLSRFSR